jgi:uncharacterized protein
MNLNYFEKIFEEKMSDILGDKDPAHDILHVKRVVANAKMLASYSNANLDIVVPAAWLHDFINLPKDHPNRKIASRMSADEAVAFLHDINYPKELLNAIHHAILAHSFSAQINATTVEAKVVQDADRLDGLGAVGIYRLFTVAAQMNRSLEDSKLHVEEKLRVVAATMQTPIGLSKALERMKFIDLYLEQLKNELNDQL